MRHMEAVALLGSVSSACYALAAEIPRPRGVGPEFAKFYKSPESFTCVSYPSVTISPDYVNDNYCDCPDGSDEPGTSACAHLSPLSPPQLCSSPHANITLALPGFYCKNKGHLPSYIPFTYVNDGKCDWEACCDGSDEWAGVGGKKCEDRCAETGTEYRKLADVREKGRREAVKAREKLVSAATATRKTMVMDIKHIEGELESLRGREAELKIKLEMTERSERGRIVKGGQKGKGKVGVLAGLAKQRIEVLRVALVEVFEERNKLEGRLEELEKILSAFKAEYNPNFNDEGVKRAVKAWEDYAASKEASLPTGEQLAERAKDIKEMARPDSESEGINWAEWETDTEEEESDVEALYKIEAYLPLPLRDWIHSKLATLRALLIENGILAPPSTGPGDSHAVSSARAEHATALNDLTAQESSLAALRADLQADYGPQDIFRALKDTCISTKSGEYEYELCFLKHTTQKARKGGGSITNMGHYKGLGREVVDEEVAKDGRGLGKGERFTMRFEGGLRCWNGPERSTVVVVGCAERNEIWRVREEEKCKYRMEVGSPAGCEAEEKSKARGEGAGKDEL